ncbi:MAG TPA: hypothetical protein VFA41_09545 [Ktedonobacteraceae bacterium]|nr:hypothetical protein [Ktedonobacteraceae bacterium]
MQSQNKIFGFVFALVGAIVAMLSFFALPFLGFGPFSLTAQQIASLVGQVGQMAQYMAPNSASANNAVIGTRMLSIGLWAAVGMAVLAALLAGLAMRSSVSRGVKKAYAGGVMALGVIGFAIYAAIYVLASNASSTSVISVTSFFSTGFWLYLLAMIVIVVGAIIEVVRRASPQVVSPTVQASTWYPPQQSVSLPSSVTPPVPSFPVTPPAWQAPPPPTGAGYAEYPTYMQPPSQYPTQSRPDTSPSTSQPFSPYPYYPAGSDTSNWPPSASN